MSTWAIVASILLALGVGVLVGRALDDDEADVAASTSSTTTSSSSTTSSTSTTVASSEESTTTTVQLVTAAPQTASTTTPTTTPGATVTTAARPSNSACGTGTANASAKLVVTGEGSPSNPSFTYSGPVTVANNTTKAIEVDALVIRLTSEDGTSEDVPVSGAAGTVIAAGATRDYGFSHTTNKVPKEGGGGVSLARFSYRPPGQSTICGST